MTTKSYPAAPPRVPKLFQIEAVMDGLLIVLFGLDGEGRVWKRSMNDGALWRRVPEEAADR